MKSFGISNVSLTSGYLFDKQELNRKTTIASVYDRFSETGRIGAFNFDYEEGVSDPNMKPHIFWDSDVAKWMEGAAYILKKHSDPELESKVDSLVDKIKKNQDPNGYFNIYFTICEPQKRFKGRGNHELYCAGHLMEAAVAYADATGKTTLLECMEKYADHIHKVFVEDKSASFVSPGHEEIEIALMRMYYYTGKKKFLDLAAHFINTRGTEAEISKTSYNQTHKPVREQTEAVGHSVRAMYLYTGMALLAAETGDEALISACRTLWEDTTLRKMYVTGGIGSTNIGEAFTSSYDLPNAEAYTETCAGIGLIYFAQAMLGIENDSRYADVIERTLYNGVLSGLSLDGNSFFYRNPLEITRSEHFANECGSRPLPITQRVECFICSCCPPNLNRLLSSLENYIYAADGDTLYVNQFVSSTLDSDTVKCTQTTDYPRTNTVCLTAEGIARVAVRIPEWCDSFKLNKPYTMKNGYATVENDGSNIILELDMSPRVVFPDPRIKNDAGKICVMRGPILYCAEEVDNGPHLYTIVLGKTLCTTESFDESFGLHVINAKAKKRVGFARGLYSNSPAKTEEFTVRLIPYNCFANRGSTDMTVWFCGEF